MNAPAGPRVRLPDRRSLVALLVVAGVTVLVVFAALRWGPRPGDPALVAGDPRVAACAIPAADIWMAFPMAQARDFTQHFPGWSQGAEELLVSDPALVVISNGHRSPLAGTRLAYDLCIAVGPPSDAIVHHYPGTRFDAVRPTLNGPSVAMP